LKSHDQGNDEFALKSGEDIFLEFGVFWYFLFDENVFSDPFHGVPFENSFF
jgi:hypothetical protein